MGREILMLALPALGVLAANPLYLLLDTAVVGSWLLLRRARRSSPR